MSSPRKFRVWSETRKQWITHMSLLAPDGAVIAHVARVHDDGSLEHLVYTIETLCPAVEKWTGEFDKDGKEIYEGDIVENGDGLGVVRFENSQFCVYPIITVSPNKPKLMGAPYCGAVLGNIHENPELFIANDKD